MKTDINIVEMIRPELRNFEAYKAPNLPFRHKLDANESPFSMPRAVKEKLIAYLNGGEELNRYPDSDNTLLRGVIADFYGITPENVTCGVGSDQLIDFVCKVFVGNNDAVIFPDPSFSMYSLTATLNKGRPVPVRLGEGFMLGADAVINAAKEHDAKLIFLCTPNNPTGNSMRQDEILKIIENVNCPVVVDEAYGEFSGETMLPYINDYQNLIILKTFSKLYGLAGIRAGYAIAAAKTISAVDLARPPYNLSTLTQLTAACALESSDEFIRRREIIVAEKNRVFDELEKINGIKAHPSDANFIFIETKLPIIARFEDCGIMLRKLPSENGKERIRLTIGTREQNDEVLSLIKSASVS